MRIRHKLGEEIIVTQMEPNKHAWGGKHGRYKLNDKVSLENIPIPKKRKPASSERASNPIANGENAESWNAPT